MTEKVETISELVAGKSLFDSRGFTIVKTTGAGHECAKCKEKFIITPEKCTAEILDLKDGKMDESAKYKLCGGIVFEDCNIASRKRLSIKSTGVAEFQEELSGKAPKPPRTFERIKKNSKEGQAMGLKHDQMMHVFDPTDEDYIDALEKHTQYLLWQVVVFALDISWKKADGTEAKDFEEKKEILKTNNISGHQVDKIYTDVQLLTQFEEDRQDFLSRDS